MSDQNISYLVHFRVQDLIPHNWSRWYPQYCITNKTNIQAFPIFTSTDQKINYILVIMILLHTIWVTTKLYVLNYKQQVIFSFSGFSIISQFFRFFDNFPVFSIKNYQFWIYKVKFWVFGQTNFKIRVRYGAQEFYQTTFGSLTKI